MDLETDLEVEWFQCPNCGAEMFDYFDHDFFCSEGLKEEKSNTNS
jgi:hypothetical protein